MLSQGRVREASRTGLESLLPALSGMTSARVLTMAAGIRDGLAPHTGRVAEANDFVHAFDRWRRTRRSKTPR
jgi:hypothetical protein